MAVLKQTRRGRFCARASLKNGFTYIEVLLAVTIVSYVSLAFIQTLMNNIKAEKLAKYKTMAYNETVNWIEDSRRNFDADVLSTTTLTTVQTGELVPGMPYSMEKEITLSSLGDNGKYKTIKVKVSWTERGETKEVNYATIKAKYD
ncbi:MAG: hypothetical protein U9O97_04865 [Elusimicrobiota bacterium]|nr:hypothetical protein [Elusimicrobiota bacterium]